MKNTILYFILISIVFASCGTTKQTVNYREMANNSIEAGNYQQAILELNKYINDQELKGLEPDVYVYNDLADANFKLKNMAEAERYYDWAMTKNALSSEMVKQMSHYYKQIDNLSREITALEYYRDQFPLCKDSSQMRNQLFEAYMKSHNWEPANASWDLIDEETKKSEKYTLYYFDLNKELENKDKCDELAQMLLELNENNHQALEWMAKKYYDLGENRYQSAMNAYNKKKTTKNYKILLKELDQVTIDLKKSLQYFDKLWEMEDGKKYAVYIANIYARFDDKKKSQYYKSFIK